MEIAILGAGIGGLSSAIALKEAGNQVRVYERGSDFSSAGGGLVCWPNASFVLDKLGVLSAIKLQGGEIKVMNRLSDEGELLSCWNNESLNLLMGYKSYSILRRDLINILANRVKQLGIAVHFDHQVTAITRDRRQSPKQGRKNSEKEDNQQSSRVQFLNGNSLTTDIIIGADGRMNSIARRYICGNNKPIYQGFVNWVGIVESEQGIFPPEYLMGSSGEDFTNTVLDYWGKGDRFGLVPISSKLAYWAGATMMNLEENTITANQDKSQLMTLFQHWPETVKNIIVNTDETCIRKILVHDHDPITVWHKDNVVLLGDSAHAPLPTSGQGACQALEDAWHLTNCINKYGSNIKQVFEKYTQIRQQKTTDIIVAGRALAKNIFNRDELFCAQRNTAMKESTSVDITQGLVNFWGRGLPL